MNELFNSIKETVTEKFNSDTVVTGFIVHKRQDQFEKEDFICATDNGDAYLGKIRDGKNTYGCIVTNDLSEITIVDGKEEFVAEAMINKDKSFVIGEQFLSLEKEISKDKKVYYKIIVDKSRESAPAMSANLVAKALKHG